jgi:hypothetical protein
MTLSNPTASPVMIVVAGPVVLAFATVLTGDPDV